jgi:hypothetical protein
MTLFFAYYMIYSSVIDVNILSTLSIFLIYYLSTKAIHSLYYLFQAIYTYSIFYLSYTYSIMSTFHSIIDIDSYFITVYTPPHSNYLLILLLFIALH